MNKYLSMFKDMGSFAITPFATALITLLALPVISRVYPAEEYGKISLFFSTGTILMYLFSMGLDSACIRYYNEPETLQEGMSAPKLLGYSLKVGLLITAVIGATCTVVSGDLLSRYLFADSNPLAVALLTFFTTSLIIFRYLNIKARMDMDASAYNAQCITQNLLTRALFVVAVAVSCEYFASIAFMTATLAIACVFFYIRERHGFDFGFSRMEARCARSFYSFGFASMLTILVLQVNSSLGKYILSAFGQYEAVGVFAIASTLATAFNVLPSAFGTYWSPYMYRNYRTEQKTIQHIHDGLVIASIAIVALVMIFQDVLYAIIGSGYVESKAYFMLVMLAPVSTFICETTGYGIPLSNRMGLGAIACAVGVALNFVVSILLVPVIGQMGTAIGVAVFAVSTGTLRTIWGQSRYRSITSWCKTILGCLTILFLCISNCFACNSIVARFACVAFAVVVTVLVYRGDLVDFLSLLRKKGGESV